MQTDESNPTAPELAERQSGTPAGARKRSSRATGQRWMRLVHVYTSMICLVTVLFFSVTGLTLNHPTWSFGDGTSTTTSGTFPDTIGLSGDVEWLEVAEFLRAEHGLRGQVAEYDATDVDGSISFKGPGFGADAFFDVETGDYDITIEAQGSLGVMNDLHKGRDSASSWRWLIDVSAVFLVVISLSGIGLQLYLRARRRSALVSAAVGAALLVGFTLLALR